MASEEEARLLPVLASLLERCEAAWPGVRLAPGDFVAHLALHTPPGERPAQAVSAQHGEDLYLALAAVEGQRPALDALESAVLVPAGRAVRRAHREPERARALATAARDAVLPPPSPGCSSSPNWTRS